MNMPQTITKNPKGPLLTVKSRSCSARWVDDAAAVTWLRADLRCPWRCRHSPLGVDVDHECQAAGIRPALCRDYRPSRLRAR